MRSTLLFVAVLLACSPMHAQATAPEGTGIYLAWLDAIFPEPTTQAVRRTVVKRPASAARSFARPASAPAVRLELASSPRAATALLHDSNAP